MDVRVRLSVMMFLQFAVWGAWAVVFALYLFKEGFKGGAAGWIGANMALGAIISPMIVGLLADRFMASEKLMTILHVAGAALLFVQAQIGAAQGFYLFFTVSLLYALVYNPTLILANSISFHHVPDAQRDFPGLRVWGTIGWIVAGAIVGFTLKQDSNQPLLLAAGLSAVLGVFSLFLPHTPPTGKPGDSLPFLRALGLFKEWTFAVFFVISGLITIVLAFYYFNTAPYLQQCDARMVPSLVQGYFVGSHTVTLTESDPTEGKPIERQNTKALLRNVKAVTITLTKEVDGKTQNVRPSQRKLLNPPVAEEIEVETDDKGAAREVILRTQQQTEVTAQQETEDGKDWVDVEKKRELPSGNPLYLVRKPGETLTVTFEQASINPANTMLWGQMCEMIFLPLLPLFLLRMGMKWVLVFGMLAWGLRYLLFAAGYPAGPFWIIFVGILLHGICFDFFFAAGFIHVDNTAPKDIRASAQALFGLLTYGIGMWLGTILSGYLNQANTINTLVQPGQVDWFRFWLVPAYGVIAAVIVFALLFNIDPKKKKEA
jgi:MFS family permease